MSDDLQDLSGIHIGNFRWFNEFWNICFVLANNNNFFIGFQPLHFAISIILIIDFVEMLPIVA